MSTMQRDRQGASGWAVGFSVFAGAIMLMVGMFQMFAGLAAILKHEYFVVGSQYAFEINVTGWGWIHLVIGIVIAGAGIAVFSGAVWARVVGIALALLSATANFFFIPYYPIWAVLIIALDVVVIWALATYDREVTP